MVGVALDDWDDEALRKHAREAVESTVKEIDGMALEAMLARLSYVQGDYGDDATFERVKKALGGAKQPVFYLEIPPSLFATVVKGLGKAGLVEHAHVVIEKPFGHDLESARALNAELREVLEEEQILRIDHYLGKEPVLDITYLRFANSILEPIWNRNYIAHVQMTIAEDFGVEDRGRFYDSVGAMRDVIQNHALQVLGLIGMEPPSANDHDSIRDQKLDFFKAMRVADPRRYIRGQYEGFLEVKDVAPDSTTETFAAIELEVDNWRWSGVPFFVRAGKNLPHKTSEVTAVFKRPPLLGIGHGKTPEPNRMTFRIEPEPGAQMRMFQKRAPGRRLLRARRHDGALRSGAGLRPGALRAPPRRRPARQPHPLHPPGRDRRDLARRPAPARRPRPRAPLQARHLGPRRGERPRQRRHPLGRTLAARGLSHS